MLKQFTQTVSKLPFAGKLAIRPAFRTFLRARRGRRGWAFAWVSKLLGLMVVGHGFQAWKGLLAMRMAFVVKTKVFWHLVFAGYTAANIAVTIAQAYLLVWCCYVFVTQRRTGYAGPNTEFTGMEILVMLVVTLGGQVLFAYGQSLL